MVPAAAVDGVGAVELPVPPEETVYHNKLVPVAVKAEAVAPVQYFTGLVTMGAAGVVTTVMVEVAIPEQPTLSVAVTV